jgi:TPR repeat protein
MRTLRALVGTCALIHGASAIADDFSAALEAFNARKYRTAIELFEKASESRRLPLGVQEFMGVAYAVGDSAPKNKVKAAKWLRAPAENGYAVSQFHLGLVSTTPEEEAKWYLAAAEQGYVGAARYLAGMYEAGEGVRKDMRKACMWLWIVQREGDVGPGEGWNCKELLTRSEYDGAISDARAVYARKGKYKTLSRLLDD